MGTLSTGLSEHQRGYSWTISSTRGRSTLVRPWRATGTHSPHGQVRQPEPPTDQPSSADRASPSRTSYTSSAATRGPCRSGPARRWLGLRSHCNDKRKQPSRHGGAIDALASPLHAEPAFTKEVPDG